VTDINVQLGDYCVANVVGSITFSAQLNYYQVLGSDGTHSTMSIDCASTTCPNSVVSIDYSDSAGVGYYYSTQNTITITATSTNTFDNPSFCISNTLALLVTINYSSPSDAGLISAIIVPIIIVICIVGCIIVAIRRRRRYGHWWRRPTTVYTTIPAQQPQPYNSYYQTPYQPQPYPSTVQPPPYNYNQQPTYY